MATSTRVSKLGLSSNSCSLVCVTKTHRGVFLDSEQPWIPNLTHLIILVVVVVVVDIVQLQGAIDSGIPTQLSYGFIMGYCSGMALKKVGKLAATVAGTC